MKIECVTGHGPSWRRDNREFQMYTGAATHKKLHLRITTWSLIALCIVRYRPYQDAPQAYGTLFKGLLSRIRTLHVHVRYDVVLAGGTTPYMGILAKSRTLHGHRRVVRCIPMYLEYYSFLSFSGLFHWSFGTKVNPCFTQPASTPWSAWSMLLTISTPFLLLRSLGKALSTLPLHFRIKLWGTVTQTGHLILYLPALWAFGPSLFSSKIKWDKPHSTFSCKYQEIRCRSNITSSSNLSELLRLVSLFILLGKGRVSSVLPNKLNVLQYLNTLNMKP